MLWYDDGVLWNESRFSSRFPWKTPKIWELSSPTTAEVVVGVGAVEAIAGPAGLQMYVSWHFGL
jgi:hypothetical protein